MTGNVGQIITFRASTIAIRSRNISQWSALQQAQFTIACKLASKHSLGQANLPVSTV